MAEQVWEEFSWNALPAPASRPRESAAQQSAPRTESAGPVDRDQLRVIVESGLFDVAFYTQQCGIPMAPADAIAHYLTVGSARGLSPNRLFHPAAYLAAHDDVASAGFDAFVHYVRYGIEEGRHVVVPEVTFGDLRRLPLDTLARCRVMHQARALGFDPARPVEPETVAVYASSLGNFFFRQIADRIASGFRAAGHRVYRLDQNSQRPASVTLDFVVAPHEFFLLGAGPCWRGQIDLSRSIVFNTEQPGTPWFFRSLRYATGAGTLVDLSPHSATLLPGLGFPSSGFLPLGPVAGRVDDTRTMLRERVSGLEDIPVRPAPDATPPAWSDRPIDVLFLGTLTDRRSHALARLAPTLANYRCFIHAPGFGRPLRGAKGQIDETHSRWLASQAKILLNIHRGGFPYFEWHRVVMLGAEQGTIVLSEPSLPVPGIQPGRHYLSSQIDGMPGIIDRLLGREGPALAADMTARCQADLAQHLDLGEELRALTFLHRHRGHARA